MPLAHAGFEVDEPELVAGGTERGAHPHADRRVVRRERRHRREHPRAGFVEIDRCDHERHPLA